MPLRHAAATAAFSAASLAAVPAFAEPVDDLIAALEIARVVEVMREEGLAYADTLAEDMMLSGPGADWRETAERIYDQDAMTERVTQGISETLTDEDVGPLLDFFESDLGSRVIDLEIEARETMIDESAEEAAREAYRDLAGSDDARLAQVEAFIGAGDLVEQNVTGALNASLAFYGGLAEGGGLEMSEEDILSDVWSQESETREDTSEWLHAFLLLAYEPLSDAEMQTYIDMSRTEAGQALNRALFEGFNDMYNDISYGMGLAAAQRMAGTEL